MNLYDQIADVVSMPHGWATLEKAQTLASLVIGTRPDIIVEIGVWSGRSLLPMALACRELGHGTVIGIDPYAPEASAEGQNAENAAWWSGQAKHQEMHDIFLDQVNKRGLQNVVQLIRKKSDEVLPPHDIGILNLDGNHGPQALVDTTRFAPFVRSGGFIILDDLHWDGGAVSEAAKWLENHGCRELFRVVKRTDTTNDDWAVFQRIR